MADTDDSGDVEHRRQEAIIELTDAADSDWEANFLPGTFGCHELLDRVHVQLSTLESNVLEHEACILRKEWYALANRAVVALADLYQKIGAEHLGADED